MEKKKASTQKNKTVPVLVYVLPKWARAFKLNSYPFKKNPLYWPFSFFSPLILVNISLQTGENSVGLSPGAHINS